MPAPSTPPPPAVTSQLRPLHVALQNTSNEARTAVALTFGQVFKAGEFAGGTSLALEFPETGMILPLQTNTKATHPDGSIRHAILSAIIPQMAAGESMLANIIAHTPSAGTARSREQLLASGWDAVLELVVEGEVFTLSARQLLQATPSSQPWLSGPIVNEWLVAAPLKKADGTAHSHLSGRFNIRVYGQNNAVAVDVVVENGHAYDPNPRTFTYDASIRVEGNLKYSISGLKHLRHARWHKKLWSGVAGERPAIHVAMNPVYLIETGAVPNYDPSLINNIKPGTLTDYEAKMQEVYSIALASSGYQAGPNDPIAQSFVYDKFGPMGIGMAQPAMPTTGGRPDIGPLPTWHAVDLLTQSDTSRRVSLGMGDAGGAWSMHYRDKTTGLPLSINDYPYAYDGWQTGDSKNPVTKQYEAIPRCTAEVANCLTPYRQDTAHQPAFAYWPYLVSGDYYYLEELQFWVAYNFVSANPYKRQFAQGLFLGDQQDRAQAWSLRTLGQAAYITPDDHPLKSYLQEKVATNLTAYKAMYLGNKLNSFGALKPNYSYPVASPWMDDFFTWAVGALVELQFTEAKDLLAWKAKFPVLRMGVGTGGESSNFCWIFGAAYHLLVAPDKTSPMFGSVDEAYDGTNGKVIPYNAGFNDGGTECGSAAMASHLKLKPGEMTGYSAAPAGFPSNMQPALAAAVNSGIPGAAEAWQKFQQRSVKPDYTSMPNFAIVPREHK